MMLSPQEGVLVATRESLRSPKVAKKNHPVEMLHPCDLSPGIIWYTLPSTGLCVGLFVQEDGYIAYEPLRLTKVPPREVNLFVQYATFAETTEFSLRLFYLDSVKKTHEQYTAPIKGEGVYMFQIPPEHISPDCVLSLALHTDLLMPQFEHIEEFGNGDDYDYEPVLIRGAWIESKI